MTEGYPFVVIRFHKMLALDAGLREKTPEDSPVRSPGAPQRILLPAQPTFLIQRSP
jgi:hypothetical protein